MWTFFYLKKVGHFQYVLNIVDRYTHKLFSVATTRMTSSVVIKALERVFSFCGSARYVCGDNQISLLRSREVLSFCSKWNVSVKTGIFLQQSLASTGGKFEQFIKIR